MILSCTLNLVMMTCSHRNVIRFASCRSKVNWCFKVNIHSDNKGKSRVVSLLYCTSLSFSSALPGYVKAPCEDELVPSLSSSVGEYVSGLGEERMSSRDEASMRWLKKNNAKCNQGVHTTQNKSYNSENSLDRLQRVLSARFSSEVLLWRLAQKNEDRSTKKKREVCMK